MSNDRNGSDGHFSGVLEIRAGEGGEDADALTLTLGSAVLRWAARSGL